jgi:Methyltransferase domain
MPATEYPNWFKTVQHNFENHMHDYANLPDVQVLQIGAYTGDASVWLTDHILTADGSLLTDVDTWQGSDEALHEEIDFNDVFNTYLSRIQGRNVMAYRLYSDQYFLKMRPVNRFDVIYVDGAHTAEQVFRDGVNSHIALKAGGLLAFDDFGWMLNEKGNNPSDGINKFYNLYNGQYDIIEVNWQVWMKKKEQ